MDEKSVSEGESEILRDLSMEESFREEREVMIREIEELREECNQAEKRALSAEKKIEKCKRIIVKQYEGWRSMIKIASEEGITESLLSQLESSLKSLNSKGDADMDFIPNLIQSAKDLKESHLQECKKLSEELQKKS